MTYLSNNDHNIKNCLRFICFIIPLLNIAPTTVFVSSFCIVGKTAHNKSHQLKIGIERRSVWFISTIVNLSAKNDDDLEDDESEGDVSGPQSINVLGTQLTCCCANVRNGIGTGFYRNGYCSTGPDDIGRHTVCVKVTTDFLQYSKQVGNDLSTPVPQYLFPGLKEGDIWCLCAQRWAQAYNDGMAPPLFLQATHEKTLSYIPLEILRTFALDGEEADVIKGDLDEQRAKLNDLLKD